MSLPRAFSLHGKVALVTGAGSGIGKSIAACLAQAGARTIVADINEITGESSACQIRRAGHNSQFVQTDVSLSESVQALIHHTVSTYGGIDVAVNNAGLPPDSSHISDLDEQAWDRLIANSLKGAALCMKWELRQMIQQGRGGSIINLSSATAVRPQAKMPAYIAAKHGVVGLTQTAALENGGHGIRVNALSPGGTATDLTTSTLKALGLTEKEMAAGTNVLGRFAQPEEIAHAALWLASGASSYVTGATIPVDGGYGLV